MALRCFTHEVTLMLLSMNPTFSPARGNWPMKKLERLGGLHD